MRGATGGLEPRDLFNFHKTHTAIGVWGELRVITEMRNHHADLTRRFDHQGSLGNGEGGVVDGEINGLCGYVGHK